MHDNNDTDLRVGHYGLLGTTNHRESHSKPQNCPKKIAEN